jgi:hypothetical protein
MAMARREEVTQLVEALVVRNIRLAQRYPCASAEHYDYWPLTDVEAIELLMQLLPETKPPLARVRALFNRPGGYESNTL